MIHTYKISFEKLRQNPDVSSMLEALERGFRKFGLDYYLIGATAQNAWLSGIYGETHGRVTRDLDLAVLVTEKHGYADFRNYLIEVEKFSPQGENWHKLIWEERMEVDLLPFGEIEDLELNFFSDGSGYMSAYFPGLREIFYSDLPVLEVEEKHTFRFCTIPGIVMLKLFAWNDNPLDRSTDIDDIAEMIQHFFKISSDDIYNSHFDLFGEDQFQPERIAARVIGREISTILQMNPKLLHELVEIVSRNTHNVKTSAMGELMARHYDNTVEESISILNEFKKGLTE